MRILFIALAFSSLVSCELLQWYDDNQVAVCESNCYQINVKGQIIDPVSNQAMANVPVKLRWSNTECLFCPEYEINTVLTNSMGEFNFQDFIDTSRFSKGFHLWLKIPEQAEYFVYPLDCDYSIYELTEIDTQIYRFKFYPKTKVELTILQDVTDTLIEPFFIDHYFTNNVIYSSIIDTNNIVKRENGVIHYKVQFETSSNIKTYLAWKNFENENAIWKKDSIVCVKDVLNTYTIRY